MTSNQRLTFNLGTIPANSNQTLDINIAIPENTNPKNYTGILNITASGIPHNSVLLTVNVPTDNSWFSSPNKTTTYKKSVNSGILGTFTINNTGNVGHNFSFYPPTGNFFSFPKLWDESNIRNVYIEGGRSEAMRG